MVYYDLVGLSAYENIVIYTYFAFTSLSTVGFGDYCPRSDEERAVGGFILLFGVSLFSYIMGNFISIIDNYGQYEDEYNEDAQLQRFFGTIANFNDKNRLKSSVRDQIEAYFEYRWANFKCVGLTTDDS